MNRTTSRVITVLMLIAFWFVFGLLITSICSCSGYLSNEGQIKLKYGIDTITIVDFSKRIEQIEDGRTVPAGYTLIYDAEITAGAIATKCSERYMLNKVIEMCKISGADAFRLYDVKEPDYLNTCFRAKVLVFKKNKY